MALAQIETMRHFGHEQFLVGATIGVLVSHIGCASTFPRASKRFVSWTSLRR